MAPGGHVSGPNPLLPLHATISERAFPCRVM